MDKKIQHAILLTAALSVVEALQVLVLAAVVSSWIPIGLSPYEQTLFAQCRAGMKPEREILLFRVFIVAAIALQTALMLLFRQQLGKPGFKQAVVRFIAVDAVLLGVQAFAAFKIFLYKGPVWAYVLLYAAIGAAVLAKIFWVEIWRGWRWLAALPSGHRFYRICSAAGGAAGAVFILSALVVPDAWKIIVRLQQTGSTADLDRHVMAPLMGLGMPLSYAAAVHTVQAAVAAYWLLFYVFLRWYSGSWAVGLGGTLLAIKFNVFNAGMAPLYFAHPQDTVWGTWGDVLLFFIIARHARTGGPQVLWAGTGVAGLTAALQPDHGTYMLLAFWAYLAAALCIPRLRQDLFVFPRDAAALKGAVYVPVLLLMASLFLAHRPVAEEAALFLAGNGARPVHSCLWGREFFAFDLAFVLPVFYLLNAAWAVARANGMLLFVSLYAVLLNHAFIVHSTISHYYAAAAPLVVILCIHVRQALGALRPASAAVAGMVFAVTAALALFTNIYFTYFPNVWNVAQVNWSDQGRPWEEGPEAQKDAALIQSLTAGEVRVPVISRYEIPLLMLSNRKPFFPAAPIVDAGIQLPPDADPTAIYTMQQLERITALMEEQKPAYVFIEPGLYTTAKSPFMDYVRGHYKPEVPGAVIWALKRR